MARGTCAEELEVSKRGFEGRGKRTDEHDLAGSGPRGIAPGKATRTSTLAGAKPPVQRKHADAAAGVEARSQAECLDTPEGERAPASAGASLWTTHPGMLAALGFAPARAVQRKPR